MTTLLPALLATLLLSAPAFAQERDAKGGTPADDLTVRAFHAEVARRDFAAAEALYADAIALLEKGKEVDALVKVRVGRARCLAALGRKDDARAELALALQAKPGDEEATAELAGLAAPAAVSSAIASRIRNLLSELGNKETVEAASADFARMGNVAVPSLASFLREEDVRWVARAAQALNIIETRESFETLGVAIADPAVLYPGAVAEAFQDVYVGELTLPAFLAVFRHGRTELRESIASSLRNHGLLNAQDASAAKLVEVMAADASPSVRDAAFGTGLPLEVIEALEPLLRRMLDAPEVEQRRRVAALLAKAPNVPQPLFDELFTRIKTDRDPELRANALSAQVQRYVMVRSERTAAPLLALLSDPDPLVFSRGANWLTSSDARDWLPNDAHAILARATVRLLVDEHLNEEVRKAITSVPFSLLEDDELVDIFVRAGSLPATADRSIAGNVRHQVIRAFYGRPRASSENLDELVTSVLKRIPDAAGRRLWLQGSGAGGTQTVLAAANDVDRDVRADAYGRLPKKSIDSNDLRHLAEDLPRLDEKTCIIVLRSLLERPDPKLVPSLRAIHAEAKGDLAAMSLRALGVAGGAEALPDLLAALRAAPKGDELGYLDLVTEAMGTDVLPELVAVARRHGSSRTLTRRMSSGQPQARISSEVVEAYFRDAPPDLIRFSDVVGIADRLPAKLLQKFVIAALRDSDTDAQRSAASLAGEYQIEAAWDDLIVLLDAGSGAVRQAALTSLQRLREFRELRGIATNADADARREAFDRAKALVASQDATERGLAVLALGALGDVAAVPLLLDLAKDPDAQVRAAVWRALEKLNAAPAPAAKPASPIPTGKSER